MPGRVIPHRLPAVPGKIPVTPSGTIPTSPETPGGSITNRRG